MTEVPCFAHPCLKGTRFACFELFNVVVLCFFVDDFWYEACFGVLHSKCRGNAVNEKRLPLQRKTRLPAFENSPPKVCPDRLFFTSALHPACSSLSRACARRRPTFGSSSVTRRSIDVSPCFLLNLFSTWFQTIEQATVVSKLLHLHGTRENVRSVRVPSSRCSLETWEC